MKSGIFVVVMSLALSSASFAAETGMSEQEAGKSRIKSPLELFGGVGFGYSALDINSGSMNAVDGTQINLTGLAAIGVGNDFIFDLGGGWYYNKIAGEFVPGINTEIKTRAAYAEFSPKVILGERWQLGPVVNAAFGTDTGFGPTVGNSSVTWLGGLQGLYQLPLENVDVRFMARAMTDINVRDRQAYIGLTGIQIGIPLMGGAKETTEVAVIEKPVVVQQAAPMTKEVRVTLSPKTIHFGTNSAKVQNKYEPKLKELSKLLSSNPDLYSSVDVIGHADQRGSFEHNLKLSRSRAEMVEKELIKNGVPEARFTTTAMSYNKPVAQGSNETAWSQNRRVELVFHDVKNPELLEKALKDLK